MTDPERDALAAAQAQTILDLERRLLKVETLILGIYDGSRAYMKAVQGAII